MVTLGCTVFAGAYALGGGYVAYTLLGGEEHTQPTWLDRVEIRVDERSAGSTAEEASGGNGAVSAENTLAGQDLDKGLNDSGNNNFDFGKAPQKPRFEEEETEESETEESETETSEIEESETEASETEESEIEASETEESEIEESELSETETESAPKSKKKPKVESETETETDTDTESKPGSKADSKNKKKKSVEVEQVQVIEQDEQALACMADVTAVVKTAMPCVVSITNEYTAYDYWYDEEYDERANGSGIVVAQSDEEILIVTNYHVIQDNNNLYVQFIDDKEAMAYVKGTSPENDLAIVSVFLEDMSDRTLESIAIAALGDSDSLQVGEPAIAIGNSLGYGQSVTTGVISALNRNVFADDPEMNNPGYLIQTDAAINPGNSGGALLNVRGEVVGINSSKIADFVIEGMGYAIPISTAKPIIEDLMLKETRKKVPVEERAFLGVAGTDVIEEATARYEMPEGVFVTTVLEDTAADKAGILKGDIITYIDGEKITGMDELQGLLEYYAGDTEVEVVLMRLNNGEYKELTIDVMLEYKE